MIANKKLIKINRITPIDDKYLYINEQDLLNSSKLLKATTFKLFIYLLSRKINNFEFDRVDCMDKTGISSRSISSAFKELMEIGYLKEIAFNTYELTEAPKED